MSNRYDKNKVQSAIAFARETWRNDGAEGETVHLLCDAVEHLTERLASEREQAGRLARALGEMELEADTHKKKLKSIADAATVDVRRV